MAPSWSTVSPAGRITLLKQRLVRSVCLNRSNGSFTTMAEALDRGLQVAQQRAQLGLGESGCACVIHGVNAVIVAGVSSTPGMMSRAKPSSWGSAAFRLISERRAFSSVGPSSPIASREARLLARRRSRRSG